MPFRMRGAFAALMVAQMSNTEDLAAISYGRAQHLMFQFGDQIRFAPSRRVMGRRAQDLPGQI
jgi:hypothetical protein